MRNLTEIACHGATQKLVILVNKTKSKQKEGYQARKTGDQIKKPRDTVAIFIKTKGSNNSDLLKEVRSEIKTKSLDKNVRTIIEITNGDNMIAVEKNHQANSVWKVIEKRVCKDRRRGNRDSMRILHINI